jgi:hypothetical protein
MIKRERQHVLVLPEDDRNSQLVNGFVLDLDPPQIFRIQVLPVAPRLAKSPCVIRV